MYIDTLERRQPTQRMVCYNEGLLLRVSVWDRPGLLIEKRVGKGSGISLQYVWSRKNAIPYVSIHSRVRHVQECYLLIWLPWSRATAARSRCSLHVTLPGGLNFAPNTYISTLLYHNVSEYARSSPGAFICHELARSRAEPVFQHGTFGLGRDASSTACQIAFEPTFLCIRFFWCH